ncbi:MAG: hypothetical protein SPE04_11380 [Prevotella sp.]|nr:hypothetical protein [Prevotella sp.]
MNIIETKNEAMTSEPTPIVRYYSGQKEITTININVTQNDDGEYQCHTLSISYEGRLSASDIIKIIAEKGMFTHIDATFLKCLVSLFAIPDYDTLAAVLISGRYTYPEELSCHRKAILGDMQPLTELNAYIEQCKVLAAQCFDNADTPDSIEDNTEANNE